MSAICGVIGWDGRPFGAADLDGAMGRLAPLGRDGGGVWSGTPGRCGVAVGAALGHRTTEDTADRQPAASADGRLVLVGDMRIDNRGELAAAVGLADRVDVPDSAFVLAAYSRWREGFLDRIVGVFALAIIDHGRGGVLLARDHVGRKPLVVHEGRGVVAFASNALAMTAMPGLGHALDASRAVEVLALAYGSERTFVQGVRWFPPGAFAWIDSGGYRCRSWWRPDPDEVEELGGPAGHGRLLRSVLEISVAARLRSVGPVAAAVSGGLDSASVAATAARRLAPDPLRAYTAAPPPGWRAGDRPGWDADETPLVRALAGLHPNLEPAFVHMGSADDLFDLHEPLWELGAGPARNPTGTLLMQRISARAVRDGASALLTGQLGNHFFSADGPDWLAVLLRAGRLGRLVREAASWRRGTGDSSLRVARLLVSPLVPPTVRRRLRGVRGRPSPAAEWLSATALRPEACGDLDMPSLLPLLDERIDPRRLPLAILRTLACQAGDLAATEAEWGVERRDPTADRRLIETAMRQPEWVRRHDGLTRAVARGAMADLLPASIALRTRRGEQVPDWLDLFKGSRDRFAAELDATREHDLSRQLIDVDRLAALLKAWPESERRAQPEVVRSYLLALPRALLVSRYLRWFEAR